MSARAFTILDAIIDQRLFGAAFRDLSTWRAWRAFLAGLRSTRLSPQNLSFSGPLQAQPGNYVSVLPVFSGIRPDTPLRAKKTACTSVAAFAMIAP